MYVQHGCTNRIRSVHIGCTGMDVYSRYKEKYVHRECQKVNYILGVQRGMYILIVQIGMYIPDVEMCICTSWVYREVCISWVYRQTFAS